MGDITKRVDNTL